MSDIQQAFQQARETALGTVYETEYAQLENENSRLKKELEILHSLLHTIHFYNSVVKREEKIEEVLTLIDKWSTAHRLFIGDYSEAEIKHEIDRAFGNIINFLKPDF